MIFGNMMMWGGLFVLCCVRVSEVVIYLVWCFIIFIMKILVEVLYMEVRLSEVFWVDIVMYLVIELKLGL